MKPEILEILQCPRCESKLTLETCEENGQEIRRGTLSCSGSMRHDFEISRGIVRMATGFDQALVQKELEYENSTYHGSPRLKDPALISQFPDTLTELWPHTCNFGPDFRELIERLQLRPGHWVLDVGTGPCWSSRLLAQKGARVVALDVNDSPFYGLGTGDLLFAEHKIYFERILESMTHLPFARGSLDRITFNASFHHTPDMARTLRECHRALKPSGMIAMVNEEFGSVRQRFALHREVTDGGSHHCIPYSTFEEQCLEAGFRIKYYVAKHVREQLRQKLPSPLGDWATKLFETVPSTLKQLNSALIILTKLESQAHAGQETAIPAFQHA